MPLKLKTPPTSCPVSLTEAKAHLRYTSDSLDTYIDTLIKAATEQVEIDTKRSLMPQVWQDIRGGFPAGAELEIPRPPLVQVVSVKYYDTENALQTLAASVYEEDIDSAPGKLTLAYGQVWPSTYPRSDAVKIEYGAGYANAAAVPDSLKMAILHIVAHLFANGRPPSATFATAGAFSMEIYERFTNRFKVVEEVRTR